MGGDFALEVTPSLALRAFGWLQRSLASASGFRIVSCWTLAGASGFRWRTRCGHLCRLPTC